MTTWCDDSGQACLDVAELPVRVVRPGRRNREVDRHLLRRAPIVALLGARQQGAQFAFAKDVRRTSSASQKVTLERARP